MTSSVKMEGLIAQSDALRKLILEHPDYMIAVVAGEEANTGDYSWAFCSELDVQVGKFLNVKTPYDRANGYVFSDEDDFEEEIQRVLEDDPKCKGMSDKEFFDLVKAEKEKYAADWKDVIFIYADN